MITECWTPQSSHRDTFFSIYLVIYIYIYIYIYIVRTRGKAIIGMALQAIKKQSHVTQNVFLLQIRVHVAWVSEGRNGPCFKPDTNHDDKFILQRNKFCKNCWQIKEALQSVPFNM